MAPRKLSPASTATHIRRILKDGGSAPHAAGVQWFFKEEIKSRGWYTGELRKVAVRMRRTILRDAGLDFLVRVADNLFHGDMLEEKVFGVFLLEKITDRLEEAEFRLLEKWLDRVSSWADHDALASYLLGPMLVAAPKRAARVFVWAGKKSRWHRRAAAVSLIRGARLGKFEREMVRVSAALLGDQNDMVQKGLGWMLREWAKYQPKRAVPYLMKIRENAPRLVLRTACETLPVAQKRRVLG